LAGETEVLGENLLFLPVISTDDIKKVGMGRKYSKYG
jgi:hypothetical protein